MGKLTDMPILNKNQHRRPFGGHHYPELGLVVRSNTFEGVVQKVKELRLNNGHPEGDVEQDVLRYYAEHFPYMVQSGDTKGPALQPSNYFKWRDWIRYMWYDPAKKMVTKKEAQLRWETCKNCPFNVPKNWKETDESAEFTRRAYLLRVGQEIPDYLGFCSCHRVDLGLFTFLDEPAKVSNKNKGDVQPKECFLSLDGLKSGVPSA